MRRTPRLVSVIVAGVLLAAPATAAAAASGGLAPAGRVANPHATQYSGVGMSTDYDWATLVLEDGGWPTSTNNVTVMTQWMASEECIPVTSSCTSPWWSRNNPLNNGLGSGGGSGLGSYSSVVVAAYYVALNLESPNYGYPQIAADLAASAPPATTATAIQDSSWASSHYGYGSRWRTSTVPVAAAPASAWGTLADGSFVSNDGSIYRLAGGAPTFVSSWAAVGGQQPATVLTDAQFATLPVQPANGTFVSTSAGYDYRFAGGAPLYVSTWSAFGGTQPTIQIDQAAIDDAGPVSPWNHVSLYPADGTFITGGQTGRVYVVNGGIPSYVPSWTPYGGPQPTTTVDQVTIDNAGGKRPFDHLAAPSYPLTVATDGKGTGAVAGRGISCPGTCTKTYKSGTTVTLTATASRESTFAGWAGACTGTATCHVTMGAPADVTAIFDIAPALGTVVVTLRHDGAKVSNRWICLAKHRNSAVTGHRTTAGACAKTVNGKATLAGIKPGAWRLLAVRGKTRTLSADSVTVTAYRTTKTTWTA